MKTILFLFALLFAAGLQAQTNDSEPPAFTMVEEMPEYAGGQTALLQYLASINYPKEAQENDISGNVYVKFIIEKDGAVSSVEVAKSSGSELLDSVSVAHVQQMPAWKPGRQNAKPVRVQYIVPIKFVLTDVTPEPKKNKRDD